ncbi:MULTISPECIES: class I SAM-dependent methyltransferase [Aerosakkonema]|uniref:class I SAM-dependent methyltransferase n=1 Tax=Aerosakkonema TaxID=1246629 RepID=UPI0035B8AEEE
MYKLTNTEEYKQRVIAEFNARNNYDNDFRYRLANRLVELAGLQKGQIVLDVATGTGIVAISAAQIVGDEGKVIGVDISSGMLSQAQRKIESANLKNIELQEIDADFLNFGDESFDAILCSSAIVYLSDIPTALKSWYRFLKKGGLVAFSTFPDGVPSLAEMFAAIATKYGSSIPDVKEPLNTPKKCQKMLQSAGFENIEVNTEQFGYYMSVSDAKSFWDQLSNNNLIKPNLPVSAEELQQFKSEYIAAIEALETDKGVWNDFTTFFVLARKVVF